MVKFEQELPCTVAQALGQHPLFEAAPKGQGEKTHQDVGVDAVHALIENGPKMEVLRSKGGLGLRWA